VWALINKKEFFDAIDAANKSASVGNEGYRASLAAVSSTPGYGPIDKGMTGLLMRPDGGWDPRILALSPMLKGEDPDAIVFGETGVFRYKLSATHFSMLSLTLNRKD